MSNGTTSKTTARVHSSGKFLRLINNIPHIVYNKKFHRFRMTLQYPYSSQMTAGRQFHSETCLSYGRIPARQCNIFGLR